jgi:hypothetical protein
LFRYNDQRGKHTHTYRFKINSHENDIQICDRYLIGFKFKKKKQAATTTVAFVRVKNRGTYSTQAKIVGQDFFSFPSLTKMGN